MAVRKSTIPKLSKTAEQVIRLHRSNFITRFPHPGDTYLSFPFGYWKSIFMVSPYMVLCIEKAYRNKRQRPFSLVVNADGTPLYTQDIFFLRPAHRVFEDPWSVEIPLGGKKLQELIETFADSDRFATLKLQLQGDRAELSGIPLGKIDPESLGKIYLFSEHVAKAMRVFRDVQESRMVIRVRYAKPSGVGFFGVKKHVNIFVCQRETPSVGDDA